MPELDISVTFPIKDTISLATGDTVLDFLSGKATLPDSSTRSIGSRISRDRPLRSVYLEINQDINIEMRLGDDIQYKGRVAAGSTELVNITFDQIVITTTTATATFLTASTAASILTAMRTNIDVQLGAVELKDSDTDGRANIKAANTARTTATLVVATQPIDGAGAVLSTSALATAAKQDTQNASINTLLKPANTLAGVTTVATVTNLAQQGGVAISLNTGVRSTGTQRVTIATDDLVPISAASLPLPTGAATSAKQDLQPLAATTPTLYVVTMTLANTEYSQALPAGAKIVEFRLRATGFDVRFAYATGKVATPTDPYRTLSAGQTKTLDNLSFAAITLYVACGTAGQIVEIEVWT